MAIPEEDVARVRAATDLAALVGEHSTLKRVGRRLMGLCPFHQEKSASFSVNAEQGLYYCHGCGASGDAISFVRATEGVDFVEAVERLAARAGIPIRRDGAASAAGRADRERKQALYDSIADAVAFYHERLLRHPDAGAARHYLRSRGYDGEVVRQFRIGWAPAGWDELVKALDRPARAMREAGLAYASSTTGRLQDAFRSRIIFPIFDTSNRPIALGGRVLPGSDAQAAGPKYRNSPETPVYSKRRTLYGLNWAKTALLQSPEVVVCEGYTDVIGFFTAGVPRAVATCGTSLTDDHLRTLGSFARRVVLAFDADAAGQAAAGRIYEGERKHGLEVAVASLPAGSDPADLAQNDPEALRKSVETAIPFLAFRIERAIEAEDLRTTEGRVRAAEAALEAVAEHPNELVRDQYVVQVADRCRLEPDQLRARLAAVGRPDPGERRTTRGSQQGHPGSDQATAAAGPRSGADGELLDRRPSEPRPAQQASNGRPGGAAGAAGGKAARTEGWDPESRALMLAISQPAEMAPYLDEALFARDFNKAAYRALSGATSLHTAIDSADPEVADLLRRLAVGDPQDAVDGAIVALVRAAGERAITSLDREVRAAGAENDQQRILELARTVEWVKPAVEKLTAMGDDAAADDAGPLLAWLSGRSGEAV